MANIQRRSKHQLTDAALAALAALAERGAALFQEPTDPDLDQDYPEVVDAEHPLRCVHYA
jgi:hypothetical protein